MEEANWFDRLAGSLTEAGFETHQFLAGEGRLLVTTHAARVLACEMPGLPGNAFWHNPKLERSGDAKEVMAAAGGGLGGDRLWIAPEVGFIFTDLPAARIDPLANEALPASMDPAAWSVDTRSTGGVTLTTDMTLRDHRLLRRIELHATRQLELVAGPAHLPPGVSHLGFALRNELTLTGGDEGAMAGGWDLLQVPPTGTLHCPVTVAGLSPRSYYDPFGEHHVHADATGVRFLIDGKRRVKMGLLAEHTTGRMAFFHPAEDGRRALVILRVFAPQPGEPYVDLPRDSDELLGGDCLQAYNHLEGIGDFPPFGEMEYHDPALFVGSGPDRRAGQCVTHVFTGDTQALRQAVEPLLGMELQAIEA